MAGVAGTRIVGAVARHPLAWGVAWSLAFGALLVVALVAEWPTWADALVLTAMVVPSLAATVTVLHATPRRHFDEMGSVFGHFAVRYAALVIAVIAWSASVVVGAAISQAIQLAAEGREDEVIGIGFDIMVFLVPILVGLLWAAFVLRCAWFLARVRGWSEAPAADRVPTPMLEGRPALRRTVIGLAHPALFGATGLVVALMLPALQGTLEVIA
ncbi:hypothetical protein [Agromyces sp. ZXT2-6]|uniref:hypothetical protein n=1 Tax=Agromyces sp. ZXT2-6 TaxID=3461153 RepID=UPI004054B9A1